MKRKRDKGSEFSIIAVSIAAFLFALGVAWLIINSPSPLY